MEMVLPGVGCCMHAASKAVRTFRKEGLACYSYHSRGILGAVILNHKSHDVSTYNWLNKTR
jgi:hypothetical protein